MLMKYKDFKRLSQSEMKNIVGGNAAPNCTASITCGNGRTYTCAGNTGTGGGSSLGCSGEDGTNATCYYNDDNNNWAFASVQCHGSGDPTIIWGTVAL